MCLPKNVYNGSWWYDDNETTEALKRRKRDIQRHYLGENKWPSASDGQLKNAIDSYAEKNAELAQTLLQLLSEGIVGSDDLFHEAFGDSALQVQRLTRYPATGDVTDRREGEIGSGVHTDYGGVTLLHADGPGLQVLRPNLTSSQVMRRCQKFSLKLNSFFLREGPQRDILC